MLHEHNNFVICRSTPRTSSSLLKSRVFSPSKGVKLSFLFLLVSFRFLLCFNIWCLVSRLKNWEVRGFGPLPPPGKRWQVLTSLAVIMTPAFSATLSTSARTSLSGSSFTPKMSTFSLRPYYSMLSASIIGGQSSTVENFIFCSSSIAQKPERKGLAKKFW